MSAALGKVILDACCGGRMFWYDKQHPAALFVDVRRRGKGFMALRPNFEVAPDYVGDFRDLPFPSGSFKLVVFDPPHVIRSGNEKSCIAKRYGTLAPKTWRDDIRLGFRECWRVLEDYGVLIFKWAECDKKVSELETLFPSQPLFGSRPNSRGDSNGSRTVWLVFMKIPKLEVLSGKEKETYQL